MKYTETGTMESKQFKNKELNIRIDSEQIRECVTDCNLYFNGIVCLLQKTDKILFLDLWYEISLDHGLSRW